MSHSRCDVAVVGCGPAGAAAAIRLRARTGADVVAVEASDYALFRVGESLPPEAGLLLKELDVWDAFARDGHSPSHATCSIWGDERPGYSDFLFKPFGTGWHLDRARFDSTLSLEAERRGVHVLRKHRAFRFERARESDGRFSIQLRNGARETSTLEASFVIDATGRRAAFGSALGARRRALDRLVGVGALFEPVSVKAARDAVTLVEASERGWWYSVSLPGGRRAAVFLSDADLVANDGLSEPARWFERLEATDETRRRLEGYRSDDALRIFSAATQWLEPVCGAGWLAVGDAATSVDPLSSLGIFKALETGIEAADAIASSWKGSSDGLERFEKFETRRREEFREYRAQRRQYYALERRWLESPFWKRRSSDVG